MCYSFHKIYAATNHSKVAHVLCLSHNDDMFRFAAHISYMADVVVLMRVLGYFDGIPFHANINL